MQLLRQATMLARIFDGEVVLAKTNSDSITSHHKDKQ